MKVTSVEIHPEPATDFISLSFRDLKAATPYNILSITGLDADQIVPRYYPGTGTSKFYNLSLESRVIAIQVALNPRFTQNESYSDLRDTLYKRIAYSRSGKVTLQFKNGAATVATIVGFISKFEAPYFEKKPVVTITINCDDPLFKALDPTVIDVNGLNPANTLVSDFVSTAPHGVTFVFTEIAGMGPAGAIIISDPTDPSWTFSVTPNTNPLVNDTLTIISDMGKKDVYITSGGVKTYLAGKITPGSSWPMIFPGDNRFAINNPTSWRWTTISHYPSYWGV